MEDFSGVTHVKWRPEAAGFIPYHGSGPHVVLAVRSTKPSELACVGHPKIVTIRNCRGQNVEVSGLLLKAVNPDS